MMTSALQQVSWETCAVEPARDRELESYARRKQGILRGQLHKRFTLDAMPPQLVKGIDEPVVTYAVRDSPAEMSIGRREPVQKTAARS